MKKLLLILIIFPFITFAQKIEKKNTPGVFELKECVSNYCTVVAQVSGASINYYAGIDEGGICNFIEPDGSKKKFRSNVELLNFMHQNGWNFITTIGEGSTGAAVQYVFEKKNSNG
jgi:hypothetical protein